MGDRLFCTLSKKLSSLKTQQISKLSQFFPKNSGYLSKTQFSGNKKSNLKDDLLNKNAKNAFLKVKNSKNFKTQAEISKKLKSISSKLNFPATTVVAVAQKVSKK